jgi:hypothetical protein
MKEKQALTAVINNREYRPRYQKATKKAKPAPLDEFEPVDRLSPEISHPAVNSQAG